MSEQELIDSAVAQFLNTKAEDARVTILDVALGITGDDAVNRGFATQIGLALRRAHWAPIGRARPRTYMRRVRWPSGKLVP